MTKHFRSDVFQSGDDLPHHVDAFCEQAFVHGNGAAICTGLNGKAKLRLTCEQPFQARSRAVLKHSHGVGNIRKAMRQLCLLTRSDIGGRFCEGPLPALVVLEESSEGRNAKDDTKEELPANWTAGVGDIGGFGSLPCCSKLILRNGSAIKRELGRQLNQAEVARQGHLESQMLRPGTVWASAELESRTRTAVQRQGSAIGKADVFTQRSSLCDQVDRCIGMAESEERLPGHPCRTS